MNGCLPGKWQRLLPVLLLSLSFRGWTAEADFAAQCAERAAIERVYYEHRIGTKPPFEETLSAAALENLVRKDQAREQALEQAYGVTITPAMLDEEVKRINSTTRAPEMLAEIKAALGNDPEKFANAFAKPFLVERLLRDKFDNDDVLHAVQRHECENVRNRLLAAKANGMALTNLVQLFKQAGGKGVSEISWELTPPTAAAKTPTAEEMEIKQRFGPDAQLLSAPGGERDRRFYFDDLPGELQRVLRAQLRQAGDVSAVIEMPGGFLLYLAEEKTPEKLSVAMLSIRKRDFEAWLQKESKFP